MGLPLRKDDRRYTYKDYCTWPEEERWELIDGTAWNMSPAPNRAHQQVSFRLSGIIGDYIKNGPCEAYTAPFDVLLPWPDELKEGDFASVVQPDISVICDPNKLTDKGCTGAPDWIIEIISPSTAAKDFNEKLRLYERHRVREYWIADPGNKYIYVYILNLDTEIFDEALIYEKTGEDVNVPSAVLRGLSVNLKEIFT